MYADMFNQSKYRFVSLTMVSLRSSYANANDTITLVSIQMQMSMHLVIVTPIVIMADFIIICHDNDCDDYNLMHANLHLYRKECFLYRFRLAKKFHKLTNIFIVFFIDHPNQ